MEHNNSYDEKFSHNMLYCRVTHRDTSIESFREMKKEDNREKTGEPIKSAPHVFHMITESVFNPFRIKREIPCSLFDHGI